MSVRDLKAKGYCGTAPFTHFFPSPSLSHLDRSHCAGLCLYYLLFVVKFADETEVSGKKKSPARDYLLPL